MPEPGLKLILIRHGQTEENAGDIVQGHLDGALSELGREQAAAIGTFLSGLEIDAVYASDLQRALTTAVLALASSTGAPAVVKDPRLREQSFGVFEGQPVEDLLVDMRDRGQDWVTFYPEGGESRALLRTRAQAFLEDIVCAHQCGTVVAFTHYGFINTLMRIVDNSGDPEMDHEIANASINIFRLFADRLEAESINDITHLTGALKPQPLSLTLRSSY